ncbi:MAG: Fic family protein [Gammaproteobacteria bacterium]|nr:Fic family protein [Gammaproteobacteria bacterium]
MISQSAKLAESLDYLHNLQKKGIVAIRSRDLSRTHLTRLKKNGFLKEVIKGWYIASRPDEPPGDSTAWYISFWHFCASYLNTRFKQTWCLSPEQSLLLHAENWTVPKQLLVRTKKGNNKITQLPFYTSLLDVRYTLPHKTDIEEKNGLRLFAKIPALIACSPAFFKNYPTDIRTVLSTIQDASEILPALLEGGHSTIAGRFIGAFRNIGQHRLADDIQKTMSAAGYTIRVSDPFKAELPIKISSNTACPGATRLRILWHEMRTLIIERFPKPLNIKMDTKTYLKVMDDQYILDAYHSLSIEGYQVSPELIDKIRHGHWNPHQNVTAREHTNTLAARGYWQAFQAVKRSVKKVLSHQNPGQVALQDHGDWFRELFGPSVVANLLKPAELAGYRRHPVYIRHSMHVPPNFLTISTLMQTFFELLTQEQDAAVRIVLGHFFFVFIHPYMDGNGRIARFLMNLMFAAGKYPWTIIPIEHRTDYMRTLEEASIHQNIVPFCDFLAECTQRNL